MVANGLQQRQLANLAGISPTTLNNWLRSYSYPEPENLPPIPNPKTCSNWQLHCTVKCLI